MDTSNRIMEEAVGRIRDTEYTVTEMTQREQQRGNRWKVNIKQSFRIL